MPQPMPTTECMICRYEHDGPMGRTPKEDDAIVLRPEDLRGAIDLVGVFGRAGSIHIEIGSGKGTFLVQEAKAHPEVDFLGIEWANKYYCYAADRLARWRLTNVRITRADAATFLRECVPAGSVDCFHVYFPDPWPKRRHHKRRFVQKENLEMLIQCLRPAGKIQLATDHREYFEQMQQVTSALRSELEEIEFTRPAGAEEGELTGTNYERKYIKDRRTIFTLALRKRSS
jgi:tRNA (guanine-N7-)-methyltransferase